MNKRDDVELREGTQGNPIKLSLNNMKKASCKTKGKTKNNEPMPLYFSTR
jgi:hypothetical protein